MNKRVVMSTLIALAGSLPQLGAAVSDEPIFPVKPEAVRYEPGKCKCGRRISENKRLCLACKELA